MYLRDTYIYTYIYVHIRLATLPSDTVVLELHRDYSFLRTLYDINNQIQITMDPSLLEQFLGPSSTQFQLPTLTEDENDEMHPSLSTGFQRLSDLRKSLPGKTCAYLQGLTHSLTTIY